MGDWKLIMNEADLPIWPVVTTKHVPEEFVIDWGGTMNWYLFNISADPSESVNLMTAHPEIVQRLSSKMMSLKATMVSSSWCKAMPTADKTFNGTMFIGPWLSNNNPTCNITCVEGESGTPPDGQSPEGSGDGVSTEALSAEVDPKTLRLNGADFGVEVAPATVPDFVDVASLWRMWGM
eukprot:FR740200.1.p1 GENE.FR740200.1~~FR740200.1.p1  ORF type:complete len:199 (+),score=14.21 FR740200.1:61-597(+)